MAHGLFITLEGGEGSGKSTLMARMKEKLESQGHEVVTLREPGGTSFAEGLREVFLAHDNLTAESAALLMNAARTDNIDKIIQPALDAGKIVISDRFSGSSLVYQGIRKGQYPIVDQITRHIPMVTVFVDVPPEVGLERIATNNRETNRLDGLPLDEHYAIYDGYHNLSALKPDVYWDVVLDGTLSLGELDDQLERRLVPALSNCVHNGLTTEQTKQHMREARVTA